jgi:Fur family ferric uptake transcriptional regulator
MLARQEPGLLELREDAIYRREADVDALGEEAPVDVLRRQVRAVSSPNDLKTIGLKATLPRLRILELFEKSTVRHLSAEDVYRILAKDGTDTGLATVYRVLTQFEQAGLLIRHHFETGKAVFELNRGGHHDHLVCVQCGRVEEFFDAEIEKRQEKIAKDRGFRIHDHSLHIYADCIRDKCPYRDSPE